jgi:hypothetical protein
MNAGDTYGCNTTFYPVQSSSDQNLCTTGDSGGAPGGDGGEECAEDTCDAEQDIPITGGTAGGPPTTPTTPTTPGGGSTGGGGGTGGTPTGPGTGPRGDEDADGLCEAGEDCEGNNISNELLKRILDNIIGDGLDTGPGVNDIIADGAEQSEEMYDQANQNKEAADQRFTDELDDSISSFGGDFDAIFVGGGECPVIDNSTYRGWDYSMDTNVVGDVLRAINTLVLWVFLGLWGWGYVYRSAVSSS